LGFGECLGSMPVVLSGDLDPASQICFVGFLFALTSLLLRSMLGGEERVVVRLNKDCTRLQSFVVESRRLWASSGHHGGEGRRLVAVASLGGEISSCCRFVFLLLLWLAGVAREERVVTRLPQDLERRQWCCALSEQNLNGSFVVGIQSSCAAAQVLQELYFDTSSTIGCRPHAKIYGCRAAAPSLPVGVR
jgi:hypothetical protein